MRRRIDILLLAVLVVVSGCGQRKGSETAKPFPYAAVPTALTDRAEQMKYFAHNYWKPFLSGHEGVDSLETVQALSNYAALLQQIPYADALDCMAALHKGIEEVQAAEGGEFYGNMTALVSKYFYDPNSPVRDEDLYLPFLSLMAESEYTPDEERPGLRASAALFSLNGRGTRAADFTFRTADGRNHRLWKVEAQHTILFFTNPGCASCRDIIEALCSDAYVSDLVNSGRIAVVNVYVDEDLSAWKEHLDSYPTIWINGYDPELIIREDRIYSLRAIPSIYLLDEDKNVLLKDTPLERLMMYIKQRI